MLSELVLRFFIGGLVVSAFAVVGDLLRPKTFAGILGAAPSVALATLGLTFAKRPPDYVGTEGRSMIAGAIAFFVYSLLVAWLLAGRRWPALLAAGVAWALWLAVALGLWVAFLR
jgi:uncharacterized membrane protein (GlpM family)